MPQLLERAASPPAPPHLSCRFSWVPPRPLKLPFGHSDPSALIQSFLYLLPICGPSDHLPSLWLLLAFTCYFSLLFQSPCRPHHFQSSLLHSCLGLNSLLSTIPCSTSAAASTLRALPQPLFLTFHSPFLTLPYPELLRSLMVSKSLLIFSWPLDLFFFFTDNLIFAQQECLYPANEFPPTLGYLQCKGGGFTIN